MSDGRTGDRIRLEDDERLDKPDTLAISELVENTIVRTLGGIMGFSSGCLQVPTITYSSGSQGGVHALSGFTVWQASSSGSPTEAHDGRILRYDPAKTWQNALTIDFDAYTTSGAVAWIRRVESSEDTDARKRWVVSAGDEETFSLATRTRESVEVGISSGYSSVPSAEVATNPWVPFAVLGSYNSGGSTVDIDPITVWDGMGNDGSIVGTTTTGMGTLLESTPKDAGLGRMLYFMRLYMAYMQSSAIDTAWRTFPSRGLKQLDSDLTTAEDGLTPLQGHRAWSSGTAEFLTSSSTFSLSGYANRNVASVSTASHGSAKKCGVTLTGIGGGYTIVSVVALSYTDSVSGVDAPATVHVDMQDRNPDNGGPHFYLEGWDDAGSEVNTSFIFTVFLEST